MEENGIRNGINFPNLINKDTSLMAGKESPKNFQLMVKTLRKILNRERADKRYTQADIDEVMHMTRKTLQVVMLED